MSPTVSSYNSLRDLCVLCVSAVVRVNVNLPPRHNGRETQRGNPQKRTAFVMAFGLTIFLSAVSVSAKTLDIYFIDVEGGAATLIVTPLGESILVDSGFPGDRDAGRIARVARNFAHLKQIDHYITTHWHRDHFGGIAPLVQLIPVNRFYDHGLPTGFAVDIPLDLIDVYKKTTQGR